MCLNGFESKNFEKLFRFTIFESEFGIPGSPGSLEGILGPLETLLDLYRLSRVILRVSWPLGPLEGLLGPLEILMGSL